MPCYYYYYCYNDDDDAPILPGDQLVCSILFFVDYYNLDAWGDWP